MRLSRACALGVSAAALLAGACGGAAPTPTPTAPPAGAPSPTRPAPTVAAPGPQPTATPTRAAPTPPPPTVARVPPAGRMVFALSDLGGQALDPLLTRTALEQVYRWAIYDSILWVNPKGELVGGLASRWAVDPDQRGWTFTLRQGVKFHTGAELTADDVVFTVTRGRNPDVRAKLRAAPLTPGPFEQTFEKIEAKDRYTVNYRFKSSYGSIDFAIAPSTGGGTAVIPQGYLSKDPYSTVLESKPVGAGVFKYDSRSIGEFMQLESFGDFYDAARMPNYKTLCLQIVPEGSTRMAMLRTGEADLIPLLETAEIKEAKGLSKAGVTIFRGDGAWGSYILFSAVQNPAHPTSDVRVRRAMNMAIDRQAMADKLYEGEAEPYAVMMFPRGTFGRHEGIKPYPYDAAGAKKLLAEAGYPNGFDQELRYRAPRDRVWVEAVGENLRAIGIRVTLKPMETGAFNAEWTTKRAAPGALGPIFGSGRYDPFGLLPAMIGTGGSYSYLSDARIDDLILKATTTMDRAAQERFLKEFQAYVYDNALVMAVLEGPALYAGGPRIENWTVIPASRDPVGVEYIKLRR